MGYLEIIWDNIVQDVYALFFHRSPLLVIILVEDYAPVFTSGIDFADVSGLMKLILGLCDLIYAMFRIFISGSIMGIYICIGIYFALWTHLTVYRRWGRVWHFWHEALKSGPGGTVT